MIGAPVRPGRQPTVANLSAPLLANTRHTSSWSSPRMFTQKAPAASMRGQLDEVFPGRNATSGGSSDTEGKDPMAKPAGCRSSPTAVTTTTPVGKWPSTWRNFASSNVDTCSSGFTGGRVVGRDGRPSTSEGDGQPFGRGHDFERPSRAVSGGERAIQHVV